MPSIYGLPLEDLSAWMRDNGEPGFRAKQLADWLYKKRVDDWSAMRNLPTALRAKLADAFTLMPNVQVLVKQAGDITEKLLLRLEDHSHIETVLIRYPQEGVGEDGSRKTVCVSSQVGCAYGCKFCASGLDGWKRDLSTAEIVSQLIRVCHLQTARGQQHADVENAPFDNIVMMGMGEPLANYANVVSALKIINAPWGLNFGARRITVSTSGLVPQIRRLADEPVQLRLAISLHGATNDVRGEIMPVNRRYPIEELIPAVQYFAKQQGRIITFEYILIEDVNDGFDQARELVHHARSVNAHVNLIPYNRVEGLPWVRPAIKRQQAFMRILKDAGVSVTIRKEKGHDIDAACGQLRLRTERALTG